MPIEMRIPLNVTQWAFKFTYGVLPLVVFHIVHHMNSHGAVLCSLTITYRHIIV